MMRKVLLIVGIGTILVLLIVYFALREKSAVSVAPLPMIHRTTAPFVAPASPSSQGNLPTASVPDVAGAHLTNEDRQNLGKILTVFGAPIDFFGKVLDQAGQPVAGAKVYYSAADQYFGKSSKYEGLSDDKGLFSVSGIKGAGLYVEVSKAGYDRIPNRSYGSFGYGMPTSNRPPSRDNPAIFVLRKKGPAEPLIVVSSRQYEVPKSGVPIGVNLNNGRKTSVDKADIQVESWVNDDVKDERDRFDWKCRISVPKGGLLERKDDFAFEAPKEGYQTSDEINMPQSSASWTRDVARDYFVRFANNIYAHVKVEMMAGGNYNFFVLESYLNPSGSRNLEFDSAKQIKVH